MPSIQFGTSSYERADGNLPALPVVNMYAEEAPTEERGIMLQSRPGLDDLGANMGSGPVDALFRKDGVLTGALIGVSGSSVYSGTTALGAITNVGPASIAGNERGIMATAGGGLVYYDGSTYSAVAFPDAASVTKIVEGASRFIALRAGGGRFYWTDSLGVTFGALDFATAESQADGVLDALFIDDILILFGSETVEFWPNTGDSALPFRPLEGRVFEKGIKATGCAAEIGSSFAWVTNQNQVCLQDDKNIISNTGLEARIEASTSHALFSFLIDGMEFLGLRLDNETQVWSLRSGRWSDFKTLGLTNWAAQCFADGVFGSAVDGKTLAWGTDYTDALATQNTLERRFRAGFPINSGGAIIGNVQLRTNPGNTPYLVAPYDDPKVSMALSRDAGRTWGSQKFASLGKQGDYRQKVQWRGCGMASYPAFLAEFKVTDPVPFRVSDVLVNEGYGGR